MTSTRSPGRPRSPEADAAIIGATLALLGEVGYRGLSMEQVRARAGVGKATIYRRWNGKAELVKAAIAHLNHDLPVPDDTGTLLADLVAVAEAGAIAAETTGSSAVIPRLLADAADDAELREIFHGNLVEPRRAVLRAVLHRAVERGEIRDDADLEIAMDLLVGSIVYRGLISGMETDTLRDRFVAAAEIVCRGLKP